LRSAQPLDQSVRGGTRTDGPLFKQIDPAIRALRQAAVSAVQDYIEGFPSMDSAHPVLPAPRNGSVRFAGSWSVRLAGRSGGHHANHIHGMGWLSSALYVALPQTVDGTEGGLTFGARPDELKLDIEPLTTTKPATGWLMLFPSWLWHGVTQFADGERLTVALMLDARLNKQHRITVASLRHQFPAIHVGFGGSRPTAPRRPNCKRRSPDKIKASIR
jgi:hypothetical protein